MKQIFLRNLAAAFLSGDWSFDSLMERGALACGARERWLRPLVQRVLAAFPGPLTSLEADALITFLDRDEGFTRTWQRHRHRLLLRQLFWVAPTMRPAPWPVPALATPAALAEWLGFTVSELDWFADCHGREAKVPAGPLRHYTYRWLPKPSGKSRLLEMPKQRLKLVQRRLLHELLDRIPPHDAVHGYRDGRSIATHVAPHAGRVLVVRFDLRDFFPSIRSSRVHALFRAAGYPHAVARLLTGLCTNVVPVEVRESVPSTSRSGCDFQRDRLLAFPHLPQGAPTSPALANLCAYRFDCRLAALAEAVGAYYTRYADDLAFSGGHDLERCARRFQVGVCRIALEEGFEIHTRKTRFMRQGVRQQLCGIVVNSRPNIQRKEYDGLKAMLHNCVRHGASLQNHEGRGDFQAYLAGRIAYVAMLNAARGQRLRALFDRIAWEDR
jgi:hypothetical protein